MTIVGVLVLGVFGLFFLVIASGLLIALYLLIDVIRRQL